MGSKSRSNLGSRSKLKLNKLAVFGLDGATFKVILPAVEQGKLPVIGQLLQGGVFSELESTIPPITGAAWATFQTGVNPGRHGAFDWLTRERGGYRLRPISAEMIPQETLWEFISRQGGRVGVLGVPVTYPPRPVRGFLISGLLTPEGGRCSYPEGLAAELEAEVGVGVGARARGFPFMPEHWRGRREAREWLAGLRRGIEQRKRVAKYLLHRWEWDFFMLHFMETDSVQHQMWHLIDGEPRPRYRVPCEGDPILEVYQAVDAALGELLEELPEGTTVFVISDHGFGPLKWNVYLNGWLLREGYLKLKCTPRALLKRAAFRAGLTQEGLFPWAERLGLLSRGARLRHGQLNELLGRFFLSFAEVDWPRTRAYSYGNIGQIYLNLEGREPQGCVKPKEAPSLVDELVEKLQELRNPLTGEPVIERVYRKEELYWGPRLEEAPEIVFLPRRGYMTLGVSELVSNRVISHTFAGSGWHELEGIFIGYGPILQRGGLNLEGKLKLRLIDLFPTILYALGLPIPRGLDGQVVEELFTLEYRARSQIELVEPKVSAHHGPPLDADEGEGEGEGREWEEEVRRRLQDLGYI